jgi:hypothetical protein
MVKEVRVKKQTVFDYAAAPCASPNGPQAETAATANAADRG